jgi:hypothetical protein
MAVRCIAEEACFGNYIRTGEVRGFKQMVTNTKRFICFVVAKAFYLEMV